VIPHVPRNDDAGDDSPRGPRGIDPRATSSSHPGPVDHLRVAESAVVAAIRRWRDRREHLDPGGALWVVEGRHLSGEPFSGCSDRGAASRGAVVTVVPTARACRGLAEYVRTCGLYADPLAAGGSAADSAAHSGLARMSLRVRSTLGSRPLVPVDLTIRSGLEHCRRSLVGSDEPAGFPHVGEDDELRRLGWLLEQVEVTVAHLATVRVLKECERRIDVAFAPHAADRGCEDVSLASRDRIALIGQIHDLLRPAVSGAQDEAEPALAELRLLLDSLPEDHDGRRALGAAIGRIEFWRAAEPL